MRPSSLRRRWSSHGLHPAGQRPRRWPSGTRSISSGGQHGWGGEVPMSSSAAEARHLAERRVHVEHDRGRVEQRESVEQGVGEAARRRCPRAARGARRCSSRAWWSSTASSCAVGAWSIGVPPARLVFGRTTPRRSSTRAPSFASRGRCSGRGRPRRSPRRRAPDRRERQSPAGAGSVKKNVAPLSTSASAHTRPPCLATSRWTVARPMPSPSNSSAEW